MNLGRVSQPIDKQSVMELSEYKDLEFGEFRIDTRRRILFKKGDQMAISAKLFDLLETLARNEGRVMTHDELLDTVWNGTFVEQSNLKKGISALRQILGEQADESRFIKTVPRRGYSFVASVTPVMTDGSRMVKQSQTEIVVQQTVVQETTVRWPMVLAIGSFVVCIVILGVAVLAFRNSPASAFDFSAGKIKVEQLTTDGNCGGSTSLDANFVVCIIRVGEIGSALELRSIDGNTKRKVVEYDDGVFYAVRFSHDGRFLYYVLDHRSDNEAGALYRVSVLGGDAAKLEPNVGSVSVSVSGKLAVSRTVSTGENQILTQDEGGVFGKIAARFPKEFRVWDFRFSPDEKAMLCAVRKQVSSEKNVFFVTETSLADGTEKVVVPERDTLIGNAAWLPDRSGLVLAIREPNADIRQLWHFVPTTGKMERITNDDSSYISIDLINDGKAIVSTTQSRQARVWISETTDQSKPPLTFKPLEFAPQNIGSVFWTPDGRVGFQTVENRAEVIKLASTTNNDILRVSAGTDGIWMQPSLGGDGKTFVFNSARSGLTQLWQMSFDGKEAKQLTDSSTPVFNGKTIADGTVYYLTADPVDGWFLARRTPDGTTSVAMKGSPEAWDVSNDGRMLSYFRMNEMSKQREIAILSLPDLTVLKQFPIATGGGVRQTRFSADGSSVSYIVWSHFDGELYQQPLAGGLPIKLSDLNGESLFSFDWSRDGKRIAIARGFTATDTTILRSVGSVR